jgi:hypothetical protein
MSTPDGIGAVAQLRMDKQRREPLEILRREVHDLLLANEHLSEEPALIIRQRRDADALCRPKGFKPACRLSCLTGI